MMLKHKESIERILAADPHVTRIIPAEEWEEIPIDSTRLTPRGRREIEETLPLIYGVLRAPYIVDDFDSNGGHAERRRWKAEIIAAHPELPRGALYEYMASNALKFNRLCYLVAADTEMNVLGQLIRYVAGEKRGEFSSAVSRLQEMGLTREEYDSHPAGGKLEYVREVKRRVYDAISTLRAAPERHI